MRRLFERKPDLLVLETKTPVVKSHWRIINEIKDKADWPVKIVLVGDHVTAFPEESLRHSKVDYVLSGGDFDFGVFNLVNFLEKKEPLKSGWYWREGGEFILSAKNDKINWEEGEFLNVVIKNSGEKQNYHENDLNILPMIDRELTNWRLYAFKNGNFKYTPGTYMMSKIVGGDVALCSWTTFSRPYFELVPPSCSDEVGHLIALGVKEIMEDSGSLPVGDWLKEFCLGMINRGYNKKVTMSCNMRINGIKDPKIWKLMKKAGFRFVLFGLESANQETLDKIKKGLKVEEIEPGLKMCKAAGLEPHITAMIGYPWESYEQAKKTVDLAKELFKKNFVNTLQATVLIPYPGTPLFKYCQENDFLNFFDYDRFDQREQVMKCALSTEQVKELTQGLYKSFLTPKFIFNKIKSIRTLADVKFLFRAGIKVLGHLLDFKK